MEKGASKARTSHSTLWYSLEMARFNIKSTALRTESCEILLSVDFRPRTILPSIFRVANELSPRIENPGGVLQYPNFGNKRPERLARLLP